MALTTWDPVWEQIFATRPWGKYPPEVIVREVTREFGRMAVRDKVRILEIGCGPGANVWFLSREGYDAAGIDGSSTAIDIARLRLTSEQLDAELVVGDFTAPLPWADETFDAVIDCAALYSNPLRGIRAAVANVQRVLKPGGLFLSLSFTDRTVGSDSGVRGEDANALRSVTVGPLAGTGYVQFFSRAALLDLLSGFESISLERSSYTLDGEKQLVELWIAKARRELAKERE
jgi:SAM-dependent methyltransferase